MNLPTFDWDCCRICLKDGEMHSVFETNEDLSTIADRIMHCSTINITKGAHYPEQICTECLTDLQIAYRFRTNCESSDSILSSMVETKEQPSTTTIKGNSFSRIKREQQHPHKRTANALIHNLKQEIPWHSDDADDNNDDYHNLSDIDDETMLNKQNSEIVYMDEPEENRLTHDELAEFLEFIPEDGEKREGVWSEIFKSDKEGVEFKVMHVKPINDDSKPIDAATTSEVIDEKTGLITTKGGGRSPNKRGPYKKGPKTPKMCQLCGNTYRNQSLLDSHMRRHMNDRPYVCQVCSKAFVIKIELSRHMRTHTGQKPYACKFCDRRFSDFGTRIKHERTHTGERPYKCELCPKSFAYTHVLSRHMLSHTGEKPYACPHCVKKFTKREYMKTHVKKHHPGLSF